MRRKNKNSRIQITREEMEMVIDQLQMELARFSDFYWPLISPNDTVGAEQDDEEKVDEAGDEPSELVSDI